MDRFDEGVEGSEDVLSPCGGDLGQDAGHLRAPSLGQIVGGDGPRVGEGELVGSAVVLASAAMDPAPLV